MNLRKTKYSMPNYKISTCKQYFDCILDKTHLIGPVNNYLKINELICNISTTWLTIEEYCKFISIYEYTCRGTRADKGGGLKILWRRPTRVRIPSPALTFSYLYPFLLGDTC